MTIFLVCQVPIPIVKLREGECKKGDLPNLGNLSEIPKGIWLVRQLCIYGPCQTTCCLMSIITIGINPLLTTINLFKIKLASVLVWKSILPLFSFVGKYKYAELLVNLIHDIHSLNPVSNIVVLIFIRLD